MYWFTWQNSVIVVSKLVTVQKIRCKWLWTSEFLSWKIIFLLRNGKNDYLKLFGQVHMPNISIKTFVRNNIKELTIF